MINPTIINPGHVITAAVIKCRPYACRCCVMCSLEYPFMLRIHFLKNKVLLVHVYIRLPVPTAPQSTVHIRFPHC